MKSADNGNENETHSNSNEQRSDREHTGLRTLDAHYSAQEVYQTLHCPYPGTDVFRAKERQRARASTERSRRASTTGDGATAAGDRRGESGVSL